MIPDPATTTPAPVPVYDSGRRPPPFWEEAVESWRYRDLILQFVLRDIRSRYKRSVLGVAWTMLNPLLMMAVLSLVFSNIFRVSAQNYPVYVLSGTIVWNFFAQSTIASMLQLVWGGALMNRIYLPRTVFAVSAVGVGLVNLSFAIVPLVAIMILTGAPITVSALQLPAAFAIAALLSLGVGLLISTAAVSFHDISEMYQIALSAWYFLTPVAYPESILPAGVARWLPFNPAYYAVKVFRDPLYHGQFSSARDLLTATAISIGIFLAGWFVFTSRSDRIAYRI